ncbi:TPR domain containing protein [Plasmodium ovale]|uniref:Uncharacterized protein n=2 Tax=Plasmodium ovale TaxID=36330 RepID=A0A1A8WD60_PLAOA|nr:conserved Plasmodium protein, unknown function [Plasmodium ovale curtisi]SBS89678.1 conserved Plasmodium protein, unknown function [Plasmodium ovale curtisi]SCP04266.1 TPR domain containing protein [Plasmodium ovale]
MVSVPNEEDIEEFLEKVEGVTSKVKGLLEGKISIEEVEEEERKLLLAKRVKEIKDEEKREKKREEFLQGIKGKGIGDKYLYFCPVCFVEYSYELKNCRRCNGKVISKEERKNCLKEKVDNYKNLKDKRNIRRNIWKKYMNNSGKYKNNKIEKYVTNYDKWNYYEPSSDSFDEHEKNICCLPKDNENFKTLEKRINDDINKKNKNKNIAYIIKLKGNNFFEKKKYIDAINCYKNCLDICKDYLDIYNNLALCYLKTYQYEYAIDNCNKVIHYYDVFHNDIYIRNDIIFKSYARKALALFKLHIFKEAFNFFNLAHSIDKEDVDTNEFLNKCSRILQDMHKTGETAEQVDQQTSGVLAFMEDLATLDLKKRGKHFLNILKQIKEIIKKDEREKLKFCSFARRLNSSHAERSDSNCGDNFDYGKRWHTIRRVTFLSLLVEKLGQLLFHVKRKFSECVVMNRSNEDADYDKDVHIPKYLRKCINAIVDILILVLEDGYHYSDFCIGAVKPIFIFYLLQRFHTSKCIYFLHSIGKNVQASKYMYHDIIEGNSLFLEKLFHKIDYHITEERSRYTTEKTALLQSLSGDWSKSGEVQKCFNIGMTEVLERSINSGIGISYRDAVALWGNNTLACDRKRDITKERNTPLGKDRIDATAMATTVTATPPECSFPSKMRRRIIKMYKNKYDLVHLFGVMANLSIMPRLLNMLEKNYMKYILNILLFINESFYHCDEMHSTYLSLLINLVGSTKIRSFFMNTTCWKHLFHFFEKVENTNLLKHVLSILCNLTSSLNAQAEEKKTDLSTQVEVSTTSFRKIIYFTQSSDARVSELSFLLLSKIYLYAYCGQVKIYTHGDFSTGEVLTSSSCTNNIIPPSNQHREELRNSLIKKINREREKALNLDRYSLMSLLKSITSVLTSKGKTESDLTNACINLVCTLSRCTNFVEQNLSFGGNILCVERITSFKEIVTRLGYIFSITVSGGGKDIRKDSFVPLNNITMFFTQILKHISFESSLLMRNSSEGSTAHIRDVLNTLRDDIPHAAKLIDEADKKLRNNISTFLSYCFLSEHLKPTLLATYGHDIDRMYRVLRM